MERRFEGIETQLEINFIINQNYKIKLRIIGIHHFSRMEPVEHTQIDLQIVFW